MPEKCYRDPRDVLIHDKFYTHLPDPIFDLFVRKRIPRGPMLVFLVHWRAGMIHGGYCSEIPLETVAARCGISTSAVTRAYQLLVRHGLIRRADPGRDTTKPFQQAVALTEVRLPGGMVRDLDRYPNRRRPPASIAPPTVEPESEARATAAPGLVSAPPAEPAPDPVVSPALTDPFAGLSGRERIAAHARLLERMSKAERARYDQAFSKHAPTMTFDVYSALTAEQQSSVLQLLAILARPQPQDTPARAPCLGTATESPRPRRRLSMLELARVRHGLHAACGTTDVDELCRQIVWAVEEGALAKFPQRHAVNIALKKVREGAWSRPHRMPPNWALNLSGRSGGAPAAGRVPRRTPVDRGGHIGSGIRRSSPEPRETAGVTPAARVLSGWLTAARPN